MRSFSPIILTVAAAAVLSSCGGRTSISGSIKDCGDAPVTVRLLDVNKYKTLDTLKVKKDGSFSYKMDVAKGQPEFVYLFRGDANVAAVILNAGDKVESGAGADIKVGNALPIANIPVGTVIHNIELHPGNGAQLVRSAGTAAQLMAKEGNDAQIRMPSGEVRIVRTNCMATIGQVGNIDHENINIGKAGRKRHMGWRPTVRGSVMNPNDHPHGGGEGKSPVGRPGPVTPWGKPAMGYKTRKKKSRTEQFIVKHRNSK